MSKSDIKIVYFYMNNCYYCKQFTPIWDELNTKIDKNMISTHKFEESELDERDTPKKILVEYGDKIKGYPTILIKINDTYYNYDKERNVNSIINFIVNKLDKNDKLYIYLTEKFGKNIDKQNGGAKINYRNKYKKYKKMYADLAIKYNKLINKDD